MSKKRKSYVIVGGGGDQCPRCGRRTQVREHREITERHLAQPYYYTRWFYCVNRKCKTTLIMPERFIVRRVIWEEVLDDLRPGEDVVMDVLKEAEPPF